MTETLDALLAGAVDRQDVPFVVAMVGNADGITYSGSAGPDKAGHDASETTLFRIFSMTKAVGSTAAMILIDRGLLDFDTPVADILPEFSEIKVIDRFEGDEPVMRPPRTAATVRHLATHTAGLEYEFWNGTVGKYLQATERPSVLAGTKDALFYPMTCDPGTQWGYGVGIDWLGLVVEKIDGRRIDAFCSEEIFQPLGMDDTAFELSDAAGPRLADLAMRGEDGAFAPFDLVPPPEPEVYGMGHALYSTAPDYMRFLRTFLNRGALDGRRILSEDAVTAMLADHMGGLRFHPMISEVPILTADCDPFPALRKTHSFGFLRFEEGAPGMRHAGSQSWAGVCNTHYWFDPDADVAAVLMTQTLPFVEPRFMDLYDRFEQAVYAS